MRPIYAHHLVLVLAVFLSGCSGVRDSLGIDKEAPDEFAVVRHAPLEMPASITLPPPRPGMERPQEKTVTVQAKQAIFGEDAGTAQTTQSSNAESALLQKTGSAQADPEIRRTLDVETQELEAKNRPVIDKLLMKSGKKIENTAETLDPKAESERLRGKNLPTTQLPPEWDKKSSEKE